MRFLPPEPGCLRPAPQHDEPVVRREPPSPRVTNPTTLSDLRERLSDDSRWVVDHVIPDPPSRHARNFRHNDGPSVDNSSSDDWAQRQRDQDNTQQMLNTQQMINNQQMQNDQMFQQQQQQMINDMNNH